MSVTLVFFDTFKRDFKKAYPNDEFKIDGLGNMDKIIESLYHTKNYEIDDQYHVLEIY